MDVIGQPDTIFEKIDRDTCHIPLLWQPQGREEIYGTDDLIPKGEADHSSLSSSHLLMCVCVCVGTTIGTGLCLCGCFIILKPDRTSM